MPGEPHEGKFWNVASSWAGGMVPNSADADVDIPIGSSGHVGSGDEYAAYIEQDIIVHTITLHAGLLVYAPLTVGNLSLQEDESFLQLQGITLRADTITVDRGVITGSGSMPPRP